MDSLFQQINQSVHADAWRRFRITAEQLVGLTHLVRALGYAVTEITPRRGGPAITKISDPAGVLCVAEPSFRSPSPFSLGADPYAVGYTDSADAIHECGEWFSAARDLGPAVELPEHGISPLAMLLEREERTAWLDLERQILQALQPLNQLDLEAEPLFMNLSHAIREVLAPDLLELQLDTPGDFWPGRTSEWSWIQTRCENEVSLALTPRLMRLLYRRDRVLFVEDLAAAPDIHARTARGIRNVSLGFSAAVLLRREAVGNVASAVPPPSGAAAGGRGSGGAVSPRVGGDPRP